MKSPRIEASGRAEAGQAQAGTEHVPADAEDAEAEAAEDADAALAAVSCWATMRSNSSPALSAWIEQRRGGR